MIVHTDAAAGPRLLPASIREGSDVCDRVGASVVSCERVSVRRVRHCAVACLAAHSVTGPHSPCTDAAVDLDTAAVVLETDKCLKSIR